MFACFEERNWDYVLVYRPNEEKIDNIQAKKVTRIRRIFLLVIKNKRKIYGLTIDRKNSPKNKLMF